MKSAQFAVIYFSGDLTRGFLEYIYVFMPCNDNYGSLFRHGFKA